MSMVLENGAIEYMKYPTSSRMIQVKTKKHPTSQKVMFGNYLTKLTAVDIKSLHGIKKMNISTL